MGTVLRLKYSIIQKIWNQVGPLYISSLFVVRHPHAWPSGWILLFSAWVNRSDSSTAKQYFETQTLNWFQPFEIIYQSTYHDLWKGFNEVWERKTNKNLSKHMWLIHK